VCLLGLTVRAVVGSLPRQQSTVRSTNIARVRQHDGQIVSNLSLVFRQQPSLSSARQNSPK
jgi:hypothetical protein